MKRKAWLFFVSVLMMTGIPAYICGGQVNAKPVEVSLWYWDNANNCVTTVIDMFNKSQSEIVVKGEQIGWDVMYQKLVTACIAGTGPDGFLAVVQWMAELNQMKAVADLTKLYNAWPDHTDVLPGVKRFLHADENSPIMAMPSANTPLYLYCRKDLFDKYNVKLPETMDEFYDACKKLTRDTDGDGKIDLYGFGLRGARGGSDPWQSFIMAEIGGSMLDSEGKVRFNSPAGIKANQRYLDIFYNGWAPPTAPRDGFAELIQNMKANVTAMMVHHFGSYADMQKFFGDKIVAIPLPKGSKGRWVPNIPSINVINAKSKKINEVFKFYEYWASPEAGGKYCELYGQAPTTNKIAQMDFFKNNRFAKVSVASADDSYVLPWSKKSGQYMEVVWPQIMQRALLKQITGSQMIDELTRFFEQP